MSLTLDCKTLSAKADLLARLQQVFDEMYSLNYDSLIDGARGFAKKLHIEVVNIDCYEDSRNLTEVLQIISRENPLITVSIK